MMPTSPRILAIGYNAFDITIPFDQYPDLDSKTEVPFIRLGGGGPAATAAIAMSRLGAKVHLVTPLTDDQGGLVQKEELLAAGVELTGSPLLVGQESAKAVILVNPETGQRTVFWSRGSLPRLKEDIWQDNWLEGIDILYIDGHEPAVSLKAARQARNLDIPVVYDAGSVRDGSHQLVAICTDVISSENFATDLTRIPNPPEALLQLQKIGPSRVAMTFGSEGILGLEDHFLAVPSFKIKTIDTTGAGDVFHAGYAFSLAQGASFKENLEFGAATAAIKCGHWGGRGGLPEWSQVVNLLKNGTINPLGPRCRLEK